MLPSFRRALSRMTPSSSAITDGGDTADASDEGAILDGPALPCWPYYRFEGRANAGEG